MLRGVCSFCVEPTDEKTMRMHSVTAMIENGFVHLPEKAAWLAEYVHELTSFPNAKYDDQANSTSQALDWFKQYKSKMVLGYIEYLKEEAARRQAAGQPISGSPLINRGAALR
jgi:phage terminase large subunit-like protein